ncbi:MAG: HTTM domain-containing protein [Bacteroidota bacterium]
MLNRLLQNKVSSKILGFFRILFFLNFFFEVLSLFNFRHLIFDKVSYFEPSEISFTYVFFVWFFVIGFIIIGLKPRIAFLLNFLISLFVIGSIKSYEYHMFYAYMSVNFLSLFIPLTKSYSIDNLFKKLNYSTIEKEYSNDELVPEFYYFIYVFAGIGLFYLDSTFYKLSSEMWLNGLGMWLPSSIPLAVKTYSLFILNNEYLSKFLGYFTMLFELVFIFLFWKKRFKIPFFLIGVIFHIGIFILWPIPYFAIGVIIIYTLLLQADLFEKISLKSKTQKLTIIYNNKHPLSVRKKIIIQHFDLFNKIKFTTIEDADKSLNKIDISKINEHDLTFGYYSIKNGIIIKGIDTIIALLFSLVFFSPIALVLQIPGIYHLTKYLFNKYLKDYSDNTNDITSYSIGFSPKENRIDNNKIKIFKNLSSIQIEKYGFKLLFYLLIILQFNASLKSPLFRNKLRYYSFYDKYNEATKSITSFSKEFLGVTNHSVFIDSHFKGYNHIIKVEYLLPNGKKTILPIIDELGMPGKYLIGGTWAKWTFRVSMPKINQDKLSKGIRDFTAYWLHNSSIINDPYANYKFIISVKKIDSTKKWEKNFLIKQYQKPWIEAGFVTWENGTFVSKIKRIESI